MKNKYKYTSIGYKLSIFAFLKYEKSKEIKPLIYLTNPVFFDHFGLLRYTKSQ